MANSPFLLSFITILFAVFAIAGIGPNADLIISNANIAPDNFPRPAIVMNGVFPGPLITGNKGDRFQINVINRLTNHTMNKTTSVHWHGITQKGTNWADGAAFVNQCPIASGNSFLYDFQVRGQAGTFWYHSHLSTQYCDGLRGPLVIYDPEDPHASLYDVDDDSTVITLADWYHLAAKVGFIFPNAVPGTGFDATLINGRGRSRETPTAELAVISVTWGKRYRLRLVSISCDPNFVFSIDNHDLTVIETDGIETQPVTINAIQIFSSQRYSVVLTANQTIGNYWIRAHPNDGKLVGYTEGYNSAILRYDGAPPVEPKTSQQATQNLLNEVDLHPLVPRKTPGTPTKDGVDKAISMRFSFNKSSYNYYINNVSFVPPTTPVLLQILSGAQSAQDLMPRNSIYALPMHSSIEISFPTSASAVGFPHPIHLHGLSFAVVRSAGSTAYNYDNPVWRDTVSTGNSTTDNVTIRFRTDNPGPWFLHCHIDSHLDTGFAVVMAEDIPDVKSADPAPHAWSDLCPVYDALSSDDY
ncbi:laccase [Dichomitus squalens LYAD-421 SS1]|uniref:laccase n=1 Tax=Dichomitus squalens (strain LYAD-421) TaxID=732165 RepID=R7T2I7_DICSQ|nr:laccase [Dichomitus squalens LYAD-421 SS1]EJF61592.1 laccase [Dichomitus squalens LYAD-421 SS1]